MCNWQGCRVSIDSTPRIINSGCVLSVWYPGPHTVPSIAQSLQKAVQASHPHMHFLPVVLIFDLDQLGVAVCECSVVFFFFFFFFIFIFYFFFFFCIDEKWHMQVAKDEIWSRGFFLLKLFFRLLYIYTCPRNEGSLRCLVFLRVVSLWHLVPDFIVQQRYRRLGARI